MAGQRYGDVLALPTMLSLSETVPRGGGVGVSDLRPAERGEGEFQI